MEEEALTLTSVFAVVRRNLFLFVACLVVGLACGVAYGVGRPSLPSAQASILLPSQDDTSSTGAPTAPVFDADIADSPEVLLPAAAKAGQPLPYSTLQKRVSASATTTSLLIITAHAPTGPSAVRLANAVATEFIRYVNNASAAASVQVAALAGEATDLKHELATLKTELTTAQGQLRKEQAGSSAWSSTENLIASLGTEENNTSLQLDSVLSQIQQARVTTPSAAPGATLLASALRAAHPEPEHVIETGVIGLAAGLLVGSLLIVTRTRRDKRLRRRADIAAAAGASVLASLTSSPCKRAEDWLWLFDSWEPTVAELATCSRIIQELSVSWPNDAAFFNGNGSASANGNGASANGTASHLVPLAPFEIAFITLAGDVRAESTAVKLAATFVSLGLSVQFVAGPEQPIAPELKEAMALRSRTPHARAQLLTTPERTITASVNSVFFLVAVDPEIARQLGPSWSPLSPRAGAVNVLAVSSGLATKEEIEDVADIVRLQNRTLTAAVVVDAEKGDATTGRSQARIFAAERHAPLEVEA